jgi:hypothetical protein
LAIGLGSTVGTAAAATSSDILPGSRITLDRDASATAKRGDILYLGGSFNAIGYRAAGVAATDASTGALDRGVPELVSEVSGGSAAAARVIPDGSGGAYALGLTNGSFSAKDPPPTLDGAADGANWAHFDASGTGEQTTAQRFSVGSGDERRTARMFDVAVAGDGTVYFSGAFDAVDGEARAGLAALRPDGTLAPWAPTVQGGAVGRLEVVGSDVLFVGGVDSRFSGDGTAPEAFTGVGGQERSGLALVAADTGAVRAWRPAGLSASDGSRGIAVDGSTLYLATSGDVKAVRTTGVGEVRALGVQPSSTILGIAARGGALYVSGDFSTIGSQVPQPERNGLAEIDPATGRATAWSPPAQRGSTGLTVTEDRVYAGGTNEACAAAFTRTSGVRETWDAQLGDGGTCFGVESLAESGGRVWVGGNFVRAKVGDRDHLAAIDVAKDEILDWSPRVDAESFTVQDIALSPGGDTAYLAIDGMTGVNGVPRRAAAAVATAGAARTPEDVRPWDPAPENAAGAFLLSVTEVVPVGDGSTVVLGGAFSRVGKQERQNLAATSTATGNATSWKPEPDGVVTAIEADADGTLYIGGGFNTIGAAGVSRHFLAAFANAASDAPTEWDPGLADGAGYELSDLALGEGVVYAGGDFNGVIGGKTRVGVVALDRVTALATSWDAQLDGGARTVSTGADGTVYLAGGTYGFTRVQGQERANQLASLSAAGQLTNWNPGSPPPGSVNEFVGPGEGLTNSFEVQEVGGRVVVPGATVNSAFAGTSQQGFLSFGSATAPPTLRTAPVVTGKRLAGERLTCKPGVYGGGSVTRSYAWLRAGEVIPGQTRGSYVVRDADVGKDVACRETATNVVGPLETTSAAVRIVAAPPASDVAPEVVGSPAIGQTVRCTEGLWSNVPTGYAYRWLRDGAAIGGATGETYAITGADGGRGLACEVTASNDAGASSPARSAAVRVPAPPVDPGPGPGPDPGPGPGPGTPTTTTPTTTTPGPPPKTPVAKPKLAVSAKAVAVKGRKVTLTVSPSAAGRVTVSASTGTGKKRVTVGSGSATAKKAGPLKLTVKPSSKGKKALRAGRTAKIAFKVTFTRADGQKITVTRTIKVKIKR